MSKLFSKNEGESRQAHRLHEHGIKVTESVTVNQPADVLYAYWRRLENLPCFMSHLESVRETDEKRSRWTASGPADRLVQWDAEIINDHPNELIAWKSQAGSQIENAGTVRFKPAPGNRGTEVRVSLEYIPPAGTAGKWLADWFGESPELHIRDDLRRFQAVMEAGEAPTTKGQPAGARH